MNHVVLAGADLLQHADIYVGAVEHAVRTEIRRADWLTVEVTPSTMGADVIAAGAAMEMLNACYGLRTPATAPRPAFAIGLRAVATA